MITPENRIILLSSRINPDEKELKKLDACLTEIRNWEFVTERLISSGTGSLFYIKIPELKNAVLIPSESVNRLKQCYDESRCHGKMMYDVLGKVVNLLAENRIEVIVLRGAHLADNLYGDIALRKFTNIDLFVREEVAHQAFGLIGSLGFIPRSDVKGGVYDKTGQQHNRLPELVCNGVSIHLNLKPENDDKKLLQPADEIWQHAVKESLQGIEVFVPDLTDSVICTCLNLDSHFNEGHIHSSGFSDLVNLLEIHRDDLDWIELICRTLDCQCEKTVFKYIMMAARKYNAYVPHAIKAEYEAYLNNNDTARFRKYLSELNRERLQRAMGTDPFNPANSVTGKFKSIFLTMFPPKSHMVSNYNISQPALFWLYYPYRHWLAINKIIRTSGK